MLLMRKLTGLFFRKNHLLRCCGWLSLQNWIETLTLSLLLVPPNVSKKIWALIHSMKFLSPEVALYLYKYTIWPCMKCCCHVWGGAPSCYLELLDKLQEQICRTVGYSLLTVYRFSVNRFHVCFNLSVFPFLVTPCLVVALQPCMEQNTI